MKAYFYLGVWTALMVIAIALVAIGAAAPLQAAPPRLPPRPTVPATLAPVEPPPKPVGGWIELRAQNVPGGNVWTVVQWQDALGAWRDVVEWRGAFDAIQDGIARKTWWVEQKDFGARFRWMVYLENREPVVCESQPFDAPKENRQTVVVAVDRK